MENAVDAIRIGSAVMIFVIALGLAFTVFSQAREVSDIILYANDKTNFEEYIPEHANNSRIVGIETIIPTVRRYVTDNDNYSVEIIDGSQKYVFDLIVDQQNGLTLNQIKTNLEESLEKLIDKYADAIFVESYSEEVYRGDIYTSDNGETVEKIKEICDTTYIKTE